MLKVKHVLENDTCRFFKGLISRTQARMYLCVHVILLPAVRALGGSMPEATGGMSRLTKMCEYIISLGINSPDRWRRLTGKTTRKTYYILTSGLDMRKEIQKKNILLEILLLLKILI